MNKTEQQDLAPEKVHVGFHNRILLDDKPLIVASICNSKTGTLLAYAFPVYADKIVSALNENAALLKGREWQPIETAPQHTEIMLYREDAGVFQGEYTYCADWLSDEEKEAGEYTEETLWAMDFWYFDHQGAHRLEGDLKPTHWKLMDAAPLDHELMKRVHKLPATQIQRELKCSAKEACDLRKQAMEYHRQLLKE